MLGTAELKQVKNKRHRQRWTRFWCQVPQWMQKLKWDLNWKPGCLSSGRHTACIDQLLGMGLPCLSWKVKSYKWNIHFGKQPLTNGEKAMSMKRKNLLAWENDLVKNSNVPFKRFFLTWWCSAHTAESTTTGPGRSRCSMVIIDTTVVIERKWALSYTGVSTKALTCNRALYIDTPRWPDTGSGTSPPPRLVPGRGQDQGQ